MQNALIGYSGFVGSHIKEQHHFTKLYNSKNIDDIKDEIFDEVVCSGLYAVKWLANKHPDKDSDDIQRLKLLLETVQAKRFILISTIDVYPVLYGKDEDFDCHSMVNHAYGTHRLEFEDFCRNKNSECFIVRLPGLFGEGLKKNVIFDLLNDNCLEVINPGSSFQYYDLKYLWGDIQKAVSSDIHLINLFTQPVPTKEIIKNYFPSKVVGQKAAPECHYDLHTKYARIFGKEGLYVYDKEEVMAGMGDYILSAKGK